MNYPLIYREHAPHSELADYIKCYWEFRQEYAGSHDQTVDPDSSYELILMREGAYANNGGLLASQFVVGQLDSPELFTARSAATSFIGIRFLPWGLTSFMRETSVPEQKVFAASVVFESDLLGVLDGAIMQGSLATVSEALDAIFLEQLRAAPHVDTLISAMGRTLRVADEDISVDNLAARLHLSRRQFERKLKSESGLSPQQLVIRLRFERARDMLMHHPDMSITEVAAVCGYTDQSHMIKEFKRFLAITPSEHADAFRAVQPYMHNAKNVSFLQSDDSSSHVG